MARSKDSNKRTTKAYLCHGCGCNLPANAAYIMHIHTRIALVK
jgi:hypothetical protein